jgi:hypothetical protein
MWKVNPIKIPSETCLSAATEATLYKVCAPGANPIGHLRIRVLVASPRPAAARVSCLASAAAAQEVGKLVIRGRRKPEIVGSSPTLLTDPGRASQLAMAAASKAAEP